MKKMKLVAFLALTCMAKQQLGVIDSSASKMKLSSSNSMYVANKRNQSKSSNILNDMQFLNMDKKTDKRTSNVVDQIKEVKSKSATYAVPTGANYSLDSFEQDNLSDILGMFEADNVLPTKEIVSEKDKKLSDDEQLANDFISKVKEAALENDNTPTMDSILESISTLFNGMDVENTQSMEKVKTAMTDALANDMNAAKEMAAVSTLLQNDSLAENEVKGLSDYLLGLLSLTIDSAKSNKFMENFDFRSSLPLLPLSAALNMFESLLPTWPINFKSFDKEVATNYYVTGLSYTYNKFQGNKVLDVYTMLFNAA